MAGEIEPEAVLFVGQAFPFVPGRHPRQRPRLDRFFFHREQVHHARLAVLLLLFRGLHRVGKMGQQRGPVVGEAIQGAGMDEGFEHLLVGLAGMDPLAEIVQGQEIPLLALGQDGVDRGLAHALDRAQAVEDLAVVAGAEGIVGAVDVRRQNAQPHLAALLDQRYHLVGVVHVRRQHRGHEFRREMRLQPERLVRDQGIGRRVGLVEAIAGEFFHQVEDVVGGTLLDAIAQGALEEDLALLGHLLGLFLAHCAAQQIRAAEGVAGQFLGDLHDLLLVQDHAIGGLEDGFQGRVRILDLGAAMLAVDEIVHHAGLQRAGAEQRHQGHDILEAVGLEAADQLLHAARFELEHRRGLAGQQDLVGRRVVQRYAFDLDALVLAPARVDGLQRPVDDGQGTQAEEVELDQADILDIPLVELGHQAAAAWFAVDRREIVEIAGRDDHAAGVLADIARQALEAARHVENRGHLLVFLVQAAQVFFLLQRLVQGHADLERDQLGNAIDEAVGLAEHAPDITHHRLGCHAAVGDDLRHLVAPVVIGHIVDDTVALLHAEVDIEVGHGNPLWIEEALEQQLVFEGVEIGDLQRVGHQRTGAGTTPGADRDIVPLGPLDEVHDDEEIAREAHLDDDLELGLQPLVIGLAVQGFAGWQPGLQKLQPFLQPLARHLAEEAVGGMSLGYREFRQVVLAQGQAHIAGLGDAQRVLHRLRNIAEQLDHLVGAAQVLLLRVLARPALVVEGEAAADADPHLVGLEIAGIHETHRIGRHQRDAALGGERRGLLDPLFLVRPPGTLDLEKIAAGKQRLPGIEILADQRPVAGARGMADIALEGARERDQAVAHALQPLGGHGRPVGDLTFLVGTRDQFFEVQITGIVLAQQDQPAQFLVAPGMADPQIGTEDRLDPGRGGRLEQLHQREQVGHVGERHRAHAALDGFFDQRLDAQGRVHQRELAVDIEMDETGAHASPRRCKASRTGRKLRRCTSQAPCSISSSRCRAVG